MRSFIAFTTCLLMLLSFPANAYITEPIYSYSREEIVRQLDSLPIVRKIGGGTKFIITYENESEWTMDMKGAFDHACKIWEEQLPSLPPINIKVKIQEINANGGNAPLTSMQYNVPDIIYPRDEITSYTSTRLKYTVFTELLRGTPMPSQNLVSDSLFLKDYDILITLNKSKINEISFNIDPDCGDKYDAVSLFLREIARGLGIHTSYYMNYRWTDCLFRPNRLPTPFEYLIEDNIFFDDPQEAYDDATKGFMLLNIMGYPSTALYAPNPWQSGLSLNTFIPNENSQLSKLLTYDFGRGSVLRNAYDPNLDSFLEYGLKWDYILWTGAGNPNIGSFGSTNEIIPLDGVIENTNPRQSPYFRYGYNEQDSVLQYQGPAAANVEDNNETAFYFGYDLEKYSYLYDPDTDSAQFQIGVKVEILKKDGSWDIVYKGGWLEMVSNIYISDFQFHENPEDYARTCDGYLRMRVVKQRYNSGQTVSCTFYALDYYPQKVEMGAPKVITAQEIPLNGPRIAPIDDDYLRNVIIPIRNLEGIDRIEVSQLDEGNSYPYYYDIDDFKKGYFTTIVDCEFYSWITLTAYNHNGSTESETLLVSLTDGVPTASDITASIVIDGSTLTFDLPSQRRATTINYAVMPLTANSGRIALQGSVSSDMPSINISSLPNGYYGVSYVINGVQFNSKFAKL